MTDISGISGGGNGVDTTTKRVAASGISQLVDKASLLMNKSLSSMVKGIRANKDNGKQDEYVAKCLEEIKKELASSFPDLKAEAIKKLMYLQLMGHEMAWAAFRVVEVMSQAEFAHKRVGYLAASLCFDQETDVILLTTHLFRKAFQCGSSLDAETSQGLQYETGAAISCLASICTPDLAKDLLSDIYGMMNSTKPYIRKKSVLVLLKIFHRYPNALRLSFDRLKARLADEHQGVVSAAVYVVCELAAKKPKNYLGLAPHFFQILTTSSNNWVLIKVVKLLGSLVPLEPRLTKKLNDPLVDIITTTPAKSLLYECVHTLLCGQMKSKSIVNLCLEKLRMFIEDQDQNLKYLGLLGLHKLMLKHPRVVEEHQEVILECLSDEDPTIRLRALDLLTAMVSKRNLMGIVKRLMTHLETSEGTYRDTVLARILNICAQENFAYVADFAWYLKVLVNLTRVQGANAANAKLITAQLMEVVIRVEGVRRYGVHLMTRMLLKGELLADSHNEMSNVLYAAAWIIGEYSGVLPSGLHVHLVEKLLSHDVTHLGEAAQVVFLHNALKVLITAAARPFDQAEQKRKDEEEDSDSDSEDLEEFTQPGPLNYSLWCKQLGAMLRTMAHQLPEFTTSPHAEVQERAMCYLNFALWLAEAAGFQVAAVVVPAAVKKEEEGEEEEEEEGDKKKEQQKHASTKAEAAPVLVAPAAEKQEKDLLSFDILQMDGPAPAAAASQSQSDLSAPVAKADTAAAATHNTDNSVLDDVDTPARRAKLTDLCLQLVQLTSEPLNPVNPKAQKKVAMPEGLDLEKQINEISEDEEYDDEDDGYSLEIKEEQSEWSSKKKKSHKKMSKKEKKEAKERREREIARRMNDPFYIKGDLGKKVADEDVDEIPIKTLDGRDLPDLEVSRSKKGKKKKNKNLFETDKETRKKLKDKSKKYQVAAVEDMPEGARDDSDDEAKNAVQDDSDSDHLSKPLGPDEVITAPKAYDAPGAAPKAYDAPGAANPYLLGSRDADKENKETDKNKKKHKKKDKHKKEEKEKGKDKEKDKEKDREKDKDGKKKKKKKDKRKDEHVVSRKEDNAGGAADELDLAESAKKASSPSTQKKNQDLLGMDFDPLSDQPAAAAAASAASPTTEAARGNADLVKHLRKVLYQDSTLSLHHTVKGGTKPGQVLLLLDVSLSADKTSSKTFSAIKLTLAGGSSTKFISLTNDA
eukprot:g66473.t1